MMMVQLDPPIPLETPKGPGLAHLVIDYSIEHNLNWVVFLDEDGQCWTFCNSVVRAQKNITAGRMDPEKPERLLEKLGPKGRLDSKI